MPAQQCLRLVAQEAQQRQGIEINQQYYRILIIYIQILLIYQAVKQEILKYQVIVFYQTILTAFPPINQAI